MINLIPRHENTLPVPVGRFVERSYYFFGYVIIFRAEQSKHGWWRMSVIIMDAEKAKVIQHIDVQVPTLAELVYNIPTYLTWIAKRFTLGELLFVSHDHEKEFVISNRGHYLMSNVRDGFLEGKKNDIYWVTTGNHRTIR